MLLGLQAEAVHVDTNLGHVLVVLVGLHKVEVQALALGKPVVAVELQLGGGDGVGAGAEVDRHKGVEGTTSGDTRHLIDLGAVDSVVDDTLPVVGEVEPLETVPAVTVLGHVVGKVLGLYNPHDFFNWVIKIEFYLIVHGAGALITSELELLDRYYSILRRRLDYILSSALTRTHHHLVVGQLFMINISAFYCFIKELFVIQCRICEVNVFFSDSNSIPMLQFVNIARKVVIVFSIQF